MRGILLHLVTLIWVAAAIYCAARAIREEDGYGRLAWAVVAALNALTVYFLIN